MAKPAKIDTTGDIHREEREISVFPLTLLIMDVPFIVLKEIQNPPARYGVIDRQGLHEFCGIPEGESIAEHHLEWVQDALRNSTGKRESHWTESIAVGSSDYVGEIKEMLGIKAAGRKIEGDGDVCIIREEPAPYNVVFDLENKALRLQNAYLWNNS